METKSEELESLLAANATTGRDGLVVGSVVVKKGTFHGPPILRNGRRDGYVRKATMDGVVVDFIVERGIGNERFTIDPALLVATGRGRFFLTRFAPRPLSELHPHFQVHCEVEYVGPDRYDGVIIPDGTQGIITEVREWEYETCFFETRIGREYAVAWATTPGLRLEPTRTTLTGKVQCYKDLRFGAGEISRPT